MAIMLQVESMREMLKNMVDVQKLKQSEELSTSIQDEAKRQSVDAAKKRAAAQNVDYPCFANLVSCAHLKSMTRKELDTRQVRKPRQDGSIPAWSFDLAGHRQSDLSNMSACGQLQHHLIKDRVTNLDRSSNNLLLPNTRAQCFGRESHPSISTSPNPGNLSCFEDTLFIDDEPTKASHYVSGSANSCPATTHVPISQRRWNDESKKLLKVKAPTQTQGLSYSSDLFIKEWKMLNVSKLSERLSYLNQFLPSSLPILFRVEIPPFLLSEILETLHNFTLNLSRGVGNENENGGEFLDVNNKQTGTRSVFENQSIKLKMDSSVSNLMDQMGRENLQQQQVPNFKPTSSEKSLHWVVSVMDALRRCGRFQLAVKLIGQVSRHTAHEIIDHISTAITDSNLFSALTNGAGPSELLQSYNCT